MPSKKHISWRLSVAGIYCWCLGSLLFVQYVLWRTQVSFFYHQKIFHFLFYFKVTVLMWVKARIIEVLMFICFELESKCLEEYETLFLQLLSVVFMLEIFTMFYILELLQLHIFVHWMHLSILKVTCQVLGGGKKEKRNRHGPSFASGKGLKCIFIFLFVCYTRNTDPV